MNPQISKNEFAIDPNEDPRKLLEDYIKNPNRETLQILFMHLTGSPAMFVLWMDGGEVTSIDSGMAGHVGFVGRSKSFCSVKQGEEALLLALMEEANKPIEGLKKMLRDSGLVVLKTEKAPAMEDKN